MRLVALVVAFVTFTAFSLVVVAQHGFFGFLTLAFREPWAAQMLIDLCLALWLGWAAIDRLHPDGPARWPYKLATVALGSIGLLAYLLHHSLATRRVRMTAGTP